MIILRHIKVDFQDKRLFDDLNWQIPAGSRVGLIGDNGVGKTTLFKIITGQHEADEGDVLLPANPKLGYLPQDLIVLSDYLLKDYLQEIAGIVQLEKKMKKYQEKLSKMDSATVDFKRVSKQYEKISQQFEIKRGYSFEARAKSIIKGLGFTEQDWSKPCSSFSGGWKMRVVLAGLLVSSPDILLLDEPTNHMDTESLEWLENWLANFSGTLIVISHDRYFLDKVVTETVELAEQKMTFYKGNYSFYLMEKDKQKEIQEKNQKHLQEKKAHLESFIDRFRYKATKASQVQSRIKMLEKLGPIKKQTSLHRVNFQFASAPRSGEEVVELKNVSHGYGEKTVFQNVDLTIHRGDRVALTGINGAGKSTLSRIISGVEFPREGLVNWGYQVKIAFFSQESAQNLNYNHSVWEEIDKNGKILTDQEKRDLLGSFLFTGDSVYKLVNHLSGGEKSRLALAKLLLDESNFLILDEPGNHLDISTKNIFHQALKQYQGTIIIVSHDRFFLDQLANKVVEIKEGKIYIYPGNYSYFIKKRQMLLEKEEKETIHLIKDEKELKPSSIEKQKRRIQAEQRNQQYQLIQEIEKKLNPLEEKINQLDREKADIEEKLCQREVHRDSQKVQLLMTVLSRINNDLDYLIIQWEELVKEKEKIR
jgi:ATP-binding cassette, subfamily F, member 3